MTQNELILQYLIDYGKISQLDALTDLGVMRLASRICDLRKQGYKIKGEAVIGRNRRGQTVRYSEYSLGKE